jgi:ribosome assembly protein YihI (activator of Der GTPase)
LVNTSLLENGKFISKTLNKGKTKIPNIIFSKKASNIILEIINTQNVPYRKIEDLDEEESDLILRVLDSSRFNSVKDSLYKQKKGLVDRVELLINGIGNGNNSDEIKNEISSILSEMYKRRYIKHKQFSEYIRKIFK